MKHDCDKSFTARFLGTSRLFVDFFFFKALSLSSDTPQICHYYFCDEADVSDKEELNPLATEDNSNLDNTVQYILFRAIIRRPSSHVLAH